MLRYSVAIPRRIGVLACVALLLGACQQREMGDPDDTIKQPLADKPDPEVTPAAPAVPDDEPEARTVPDEFGDVRVEDAVLGELREDGLRMQSVNVEADDGVVSLTGLVDSLLARRRAVDIASAVRGVRAVSNRLTVRTPDMTDSALKQATKDALLFDPATESYEVTVEAEAGKVTLSGTVSSFAERQLAEETAAGVRGAKDIENNLVVAYEDERPDAEIQSDIEGLMESSAWIDDNKVEVAVNDRKVTLSGTVGSVVEKNAAERRAWVAGVESVDAEALEVDWMAADTSLRKQRYSDRSDAEIRDAIKAAYMYDPRVFSFNPTVRVEDGVVTLSGTVDNLRAKQAAKQVAKQTLGVWRVKDRLRVDPPDRPSDAKLVVTIDDALGRDPYLDRYDVTVSAVNGHVYLHGTVDSTFEANRAAWIASGPTGVVEVNNLLQVDSPAVRLSSWELREDIMEEMFWSPFVDADEVQVNVEGETATLTGIVDTWSEWQAAEENAHEGGARRVINNLEVRYGPEYYLSGTDPGA